MTEFLVVHVDSLQPPHTERYANVKNCIRYGLAKDYRYMPGQYDIHNKTTGEITRAYKKV